MYTCFHRTWWKKNPAFPGGKEPHAGRKTFIATAQTIEGARAICRAWNDQHNPGPLSRKAEFTEGGI
jgi:hypothetical protein